VNVLAADGEEAESNDAVGQASLPNEPIAKLHSGFAHWPLTELQPGPVELRAIDFYRATILETQHHHVSRANMSGPSLAPYILKRPWLKRWMMPFANWYANSAGYRSLGQYSTKEPMKAIPC
jgi:hypothetical protein